MRKLALVILAAGGLLSACVAYDPAGPDGRYYDGRYYPGDRYGDAYRYRAPDRVYRDRDGDGVPDDQDRRPDDPRR